MYLCICKGWYLCLIGNAEIIKSSICVYTYIQTMCMKNILIYWNLLNSEINWHDMVWTWMMNESVHLLLDMRVHLLWKFANWKGKTSSKPPLLCYMFIFPGLPIVALYMNLLCPPKKSSLQISLYHPLPLPGVPTWNLENSPGLRRESLIWQRLFVGEDRFFVENCEQWIDSLKETCFVLEKAKS